MELYHYNHNHDPKTGKFTFSRGGNISLKSAYSSSEGSKLQSQSNDYDHSKSDKKTEIAILAVNLALDAIALNPVGLAYDGKRIVDAIFASKKETSYKNNIINARIDKKTGLPLKDKECAAEVDAKATNPGFKNFDANTKNNCMLCTSAYELRRRGYDVIAKKASYGFRDEDVKRWFPNAEVNVVSAYTVTENGKRKHDLYNNTIKELVKQGNGARGNLMVTWKHQFSGHSVAYEVVDGKVRLIDAQTGKIYNNPAKILSRSGSASYARLDNVDFDKDKLKEIIDI